MQHEWDEIEKANFVSHDFERMYKHQYKSWSLHIVTCFLPHVSVYRLYTSDGRLRLPRFDRCT